MTALASAIAAAETRELEAAVVLLHRAGQSQRRLGLAGPAVIEPAYPLLLAAMCVELTDALTHRGARREPCPVCAGQVASSAIEAGLVATGELA